MTCVGRYTKTLGQICFSRSTTARNRPPKRMLSLFFSMYFTGAIIIQKVGAYEYRFNKKKVSDLTVGEFRDLIRDTFSSVIDPDYGLELRPEFEEGLRESIEQKRHDEGYSLSQVKKEIGF